VLLDLVALLAVGLFAGAALYVTLVEHPARRQCGAALAIAEFGPSYRRGAVMQASLAAVGGLAGVADWTRGHGAFPLAAGLLMVALIAFTLIVILPRSWPAGAGCTRCAADSAPSRCSCSASIWSEHDDAHDAGALSGYLRRVNSAILFAILSGLSAATWTICLKLGASRISAVLGALVITGVAFLVNSIALLVMRAGGHEVVVTRQGLWLLAAAGVAASGVDIFGLLAYERGLRVTSSFLIGGTSTVVVLLVGFLVLQEPLTWGRLAAIGMIVGGTLLYQLQGR